MDRKDKRYKGISKRSIIKKTKDKGDGYEKTFTSNNLIILF